MTTEKYFLEAASPISRLLGRTAADAIGFCGLGIISMVPVLFLKSLVWLGADHLAQLMEPLETGLVLADMTLFGVIFLAGIVVFAVEEIVAAYIAIRKILEKTRNG